MPDIEEPPLETTPLVPKVPENAGDESKELPPLKEMSAESLKEKLVSGAALVGLTTSVAAMAVESNPAVYVSGAIGAVVAPVAAMQQSKLTQVVALKQSNEHLSGEVKRLQANNIKLQSQVTKLESSVNHLEEMSNTLDSINKMEGSSLDALEKQLEQSEQIFKGMRSNLRGDILQMVISVVMQVDKDGDMHLSDDEINTLIVEVEKICDDRVDFNDDLLRHRLVQNGRSLNAIMDVIGDLLNNDTPKDETIFDFVNKKEGSHEMASAYQVSK